MEIGVRATELFVEIGLAASRGEAAKLFKGGGGWIGDRQLRDHNDVVGLADFSEGSALARAGRKHRHRLVLEDQ
jgi:tyrosyl-tRNA synthetase